jgi:ferric-dicitrate binding protein FerR (iron transport regulator)
MKKTNLDLLLERYIKGTVSDEERLKIEAWLDVKKTDEGTEMVLDEADEEKLFRKITSSIDSVSDINSFRPRKRRVHSLFSDRWFQIAATVTFLLTGSYAIWSIATRTELQQTIARNDIEKVILPDGTIVWLQKHSELVYHGHADGIRQASLIGEGLFEVAKDPQNPFVISCGSAQVKVLGTSFNLKSGDEGIELKVLTGIVRLSSGTDKTGIEVRSNENVLYGKHGEIKKLFLDDADITRITSQTEYNMQFKNTSMESVIARVERKFNVEIITEDTQLKNCRITADFTDHSLESTLHMAAELLDIDFDIGERTVTISGKGCQ